ncbi:fumarylacetoacetate hydrolase family protein [Calidifontimicrobium sp. SYSU G02091]|uniref:fumarylacetoacetate hydrolase family protein n=1 Tax=Calidifontimicrobium sp. SYSU G02091 TaxID=2926421 RepID=UPI001F53DEE5|nr:fumarylacetoacetate hydrolase family protein [Calidifontimicrobium sp. SYSU G02091]MCI1193748.1 fumarylacetoacetate hydrolase family protein [Calidifontimicrobium sp. SYSU G02091]
MKLATYHDGSRDGQLVVVSRDLAQAHFATGIATRLQQVLDDWNFVSPQLEDLYATLNGGKARHAFPFEPQRCLAPLPRAPQWVDAAAYPSHVERLRRARGAEVPADLHEVPRLEQRASDALLGPRATPRFADADAGIDFEAGLAVVTGDVAAGATPAQALDGVRLVLLSLDWTLRHAPPGLLPPAGAFAPVAVTPDELGAAWDGGRVRLGIHVDLNGRRFGRVDAAAGLAFDFGRLIAQVARTRALRAGSIVGAGAASVADAGSGFTCLAEQRALEVLEHGAPHTGYLRFGDTVRVEVPSADGVSVFGAIEQTVAAYVA